MQVELRPQEIKRKNNKQQQKSILCFFIALYEENLSRYYGTLKVSFGISMPKFVPTLKCLSIGTPYTTSFPFVPNEK